MISAKLQLFKLFSKEQKSIGLFPYFYTKLNGFLHKLTLCIINKINLNRK